MPKKHSVSAQKTTQNYWPRLRKRRSVLGVVYSTVCLVIYLLGYDVLSICWVMIFICLLGYDVLSVCWVMIFIYLLGYDVCRRFYSTADLLFARNLIRRCILFSYFLIYSPFTCMLRLVSWSISLTLKELIKASKLVRC